MQVDAVERAVVAALHKAFLNVGAFVQTGDSTKIDQAIGLIDSCYLISIGAPFLQESPYPALLQGIMGVLRELRINSPWTRLEEMLANDSTKLTQRYIELSAKRATPIIELWPSQTVAIPKINEGKVQARPNFLVKMPTSAGKTTIAELTILRFLIDEAEGSGKKCVYVAPYNSLGTEVEAKLRKQFHPLGVGVSDLYGGFEISPVDRFLFDRQRILVATPEKVDALLRYIPDFASQIGLVFIDEGHIIGDGDRGLRVEMFVHRLIRRYVNQKARIVLASAVLGSGDSLTKWVTGNDDPNGLITSQYRPTRNYLGLLEWDGKIGTRSLLHESSDTPGGYRQYTAPKEVRVRALPKIGRKKFPRKGENETNEVMALTALQEARQGMTLVFSPTPKSVESIGKSVLYALEYIATCRENHLPVDVLELKTELCKEDRLQLNRCIELAIETTGRESIVTRALEHGFVVHHGKVPEQLRNSLAPLIEKGAFNLVIANNTITNGVNTPVRTILIRTLSRGDQAKISTQEFFNLVGRAGRAMKETEGVSLLFTETNNADSSRGILRSLIARINSIQLESSLRTFLQRVTSQWKEIYPNTSITSLCEALATNTIDWLDQTSKSQLGELDRNILSLLQEADTTPDKVQELFEKSLMALQVASNSDLWNGHQSSLNLLAARTEYIKKMSESSRRAFYRSGLPISDCIILENRMEAILACTDKLGRSPTYSEEQVVEIIWTLYQDVLSALSVFTTAKPTPPACMKQILLGWIKGMTVDKIAEIPEVKQEMLSLREVVAHKDKFCSERMPWALNALRGYIIETMPEEEKFVDKWLSSWSTMIHFGLPSPKAAMFYILGVRLRDAAIFCDQQCDAKPDSSQLYQWLVNLSDETIQSWNSPAHVEQEVSSVRDSLMAVSWAR